MRRQQRRLASCHAPRFRPGEIVEIGGSLVSTDRIARTLTDSDRMPLQHPMRFAWKMPHRPPPNHGQPDTSSESGSDVERIDHFEKDDQARVLMLVLQGAGGKAFSTRAFSARSDIGLFKGLNSAPDIHAHEAQVERTIACLQRLTKPTMRCVATIPPRRIEPGSEPRFRVIGFSPTGPSLPAGGHTSEGPEARGRRPHLLTEYGRQRIY